MKPFKLLFVTGSLVLMFTACEAPQDLNFKNDATSADLKVQAKSSKQVEVPFKAKLFTGQAEDALTEICSFNSPTDFWGLEHQVGGGEGTHMGNFTVDLKFCIHIVFDDQGFPDLENGFGEFTGGEESALVAANGDQLFFIHPGGDFSLSPNEGYTFLFEDICTITGGTGRFEKASGEFVWLGQTKNDGTGSDHILEGTIMLK